MATTDQLEEARAFFAEQLPGIEHLPMEIVDLAALRDARALRKYAWARNAGVYVLLHGNKVRYVGRALKGGGLAGRLRRHIRSNSSFATDLAGDSPVRLAVWPLHDDDAWLAPSLELLVHWCTRGDGDLLNLKRC